MNRYGVAIATVVLALNGCATLDLDNTRHEGSRKLGIVFLQEGKPAAIKTTNELSTVQLSTSSFAILTPATQRPIRICASSSPVIFLQSRFSAPTCFAKNAAVEGQRKGALRLSLGDTHSYFPASRTDNGKRYRAIYINGMGGKSAPKDIYLNVFIDKNGNGAFERQEFEHFVLALPRVGAQPFRTDAEIQPVFEIHKNRIYRVFKKELRYKPGLAGKMVVKFTVLPSGKATRAHVVSSTLKNVGFEKKILALIESFNFGPKKAPNVIIQYPIEFLPTS